MVANELAQPVGGGRQWVSWLAAAAIFAGLASATRYIGASLVIAGALSLVLWAPDPHTDALIGADWQRVHDKVRHGEAHLLSESDGRIMGPCRRLPLLKSLAGPGWITASNR